MPNFAGVTDSLGRGRGEGGPIGIEPPYPMAAQWASQASHANGNRQDFKQKPKNDGERNVFNTFKLMHSFTVHAWVHGVDTSPH